MSRESKEVHTAGENKIIKMPNKRQFLILIPFALFYTIAAMFGALEKAASLSILQNLGRALLWMFGSYGLLLGLCLILSNWGGIVSEAASKIPLLSRIPEKKERQGKWYVYLLFAAVCLLGYLPYYLMYYPTWLNNDAVWQIEQALGWAAASNHHPYFHTLILKGLFMIGYRFSGSYTGGAAFYTFIQVLIMAMVFAFFLYQLYKRGTRMLWLVLAVIFYAFLPINGLLTICMGKDEFFTAVLLLFMWMTAEYDLEAVQDAENEARQSIGEDIDMQAGAALHKRGIGRWIAYFTIGFLLCVLRSNGIFIYAGTAVILLIVKMKKGHFPRRTFLCVAAVLLCYLIYHGPVLRALQVEPPDTIEGLTMPTQHILCAYLKGGELTEEEVAMIDEVVPIEEVGDYYNPWLFDIVKNFIRSDGEQQVIADHKWEYFKLWFRVGLRNPLQYVVAQVRQTAGYWAYDVKDYEYVYGEYYMVDNPFGITTQRKLFTYEAELDMHDFLMGFQDLYNKVWSLGLSTWLMVFAIAYTLYQRRSIMIYVPFIMLFITLMLATPVYNEFRYAYGLFAAFPVLFSYSFGGRENLLLRYTDEKMV
ncbi:MAG: hypothetical protein HDR13_04390 [Lachnospiraceae bacterium]|nr:hypothetical protein [Lachnospiraceae bacterium]